MLKVRLRRYIQPTMKDTTTVRMMPRGPDLAAFLVSSVMCADAS